MRQAADDFAAKLQKTIRVQLIKIPKKVRRRVRARPARRRASHFVTSPVRGSELTDSIPPQVRVLSLKQFSEDFGRDVSKELLANSILRAGLPADATGAAGADLDHWKAHRQSVNAGFSGFPYGGVDDHGDVGPGAAHVKTQHVINIC